MFKRINPFQDNAPFLLLWQTWWHLLEAIIFHFKVTVTYRDPLQSSVAIHIEISH